MASSSDHNLDGSTDIDQESNGSKSSRGNKGRVNLDRLVVQRAKGIVKDVKFNERGQPIGIVATEMQSYIGVLTRQHAKVSFQQWKDVPEETKDLIWDSVKSVFNVDNNWKKGCLASANAKWRQWKTTLYNKYIVPYESKPEMLYNPPPLSGILKEDWKDFVISRISEGFRKVSEEQKERRRKNIYPHHLSRKGYAGLREEMKLKLSGDEAVDRAILWKQARTNKKGEFKGEQLVQTITKIDEYIRQKEEGVFCSTHPKQDILTQALETPEHSGRVRALGAHVTPSTYFSSAKSVGGDVQGIQIMEMGKKMAEMDAKIMELQTFIGSQMKKDIEEKGSCTIKNKDVYNVDDDEDGIEKKKPRGSPLLHAKLKTLDVPKPLKVLHGYSRHALKDDISIQIPLDEKVLGNEINIHLFLEDVYNICELEPISGGCICVYIWHLYKECEARNLVGRFKFVNPYEVSHNPKVKPAKKAEVLASRLIKTSTNQLVLAPCNVGYHWVLAVIDPHKETVYFLDPLNHESHHEQLKDIVDMAIKLFNVDMGKRGRKNFIWDVIKAPQQPDSKQCGFYVMRYMRDIIDNCESKDSIPSCLAFPEGYYSKNEIDEVRIEWAECVQDYTD